MSHRSSRTWEILKTALVLVGALFPAPSALANGRFPRAQRLVESATDANLLALYGTYGLIVSSDAGRSWNHICEAATGKYAGEDPLLEILPDAKIVARTDAALIRSGGTWCDWTTIRSGSAIVEDITRTTADPLSILAIVGSYTQASGYSSGFTRSTDGGTTWSKEQALPLVARGLSLDVAPTSAERVVVTGLDSTGGGKLMVSDDGGVTWQGGALATTDSNSAPYLAAISKSDANRLFVRTDSYEDVNGVYTASDALLLSLDGGANWTTAIQRKAKLFGFALSPDESTLLVGYGDPVVVSTYVDPADIGIYRADVAALLSDLPNASTHFEKIFDASVTCLRWTTTGLYACTSQKALGFEVGRAPNAAFTLADTTPFTPLLVLSEVRPLPCSSGTNGYACFSDPTNGFASVCQVFQTSCDASAPPPTDSGTPGGGGASANAGGASGLDGAAAVGGNAGQAGSRNSAASGGSSCACRSVSSRSLAGVGAWLVFALGAVFVARRRGARTRP